MPKAVSRCSYNDCRKIIEPEEPRIRAILSERSYQYSFGKKTPKSFQVGVFHKGCWDKLVLDRVDNA